MQFFCHRGENMDLAENVLCYLAALKPMLAKTHNFSGSYVPGTSRLHLHFPYRFHCQETSQVDPTKATT